MRSKWQGRKISLLEQRGLKTSTSTIQKKMTLKAKDAKNIRHLKNMKSEKLNVIGRPLIK